MGNGDQSAASGGVSVHSGGLLRGTGIIGSNTVIGGGGTLAVGVEDPATHSSLTPNGTLTIHGYLQLQPNPFGSTVNLFLTNSSGFEKIVVSGNVNLAGSLNVDTNPGGVGLTAGQTAWIIQAGGYSGQFTEFTSNFANGVLFDNATGRLIGMGDPTAKASRTYRNLDRNQTNTYLALYDDSVQLGTQNVSTSYNQATSTYQIHFTSGILDGDPQLQAALLAATQPGGINTAIMDHLSPEVHRGMVDYTEQTLRTHVREGLDAAPVARSGQTQVFATVHTSTAGADASADNANYDTEMNGATVGVRYDIDKRFQIGGLIGAEEGSIKGALIDTDATGMMFGLFGRYVVHEPTKTTITGSLSYGNYNFDSNRRSYGGAARADGIGSDAFEMALGVRTVSFEQGGFRMIPNATVRYMSGSVDGFVEDGGPGVRLRVDSQDIESLLLDVGVDLEYQVQKFTLVGNVSYVTDFLNSSNTVSAKFAASGIDARPFSVAAPGIDDEGLVIGLGAYYDIKETARIGLNYRCEFRKNSENSQTVGLGASFGF